MAKAKRENTAVISAIHRIARHRIAAKYVLFIEALLPRILWPASIILIFLAIAWSGAFHLLPPLVSKAIIALLALGEIYTLKSLIGLRWPTNEEADRRLEKHNGLAHQAVSMLSDKPAIETPAAQALWEAHQKRLADKIDRLESGTPAPGISKYDPYGLRILPVMAAVIAFAYS